MEYYTVIRQNERMPSAATLMGLEIIPLSEVNHKEKDKYHMISLMWTLNCVSRSVLSDSLIPWTVACQAPLSMDFSRQEYWSGLPFPSLGDLPNPGSEPRSPALQVILYCLRHQGSPESKI